LNSIVDELQRRRTQSLLGGGEKRIETQHNKGKLTARERLILAAVLFQGVEFGEGIRVQQQD